MYNSLDVSRKDFGNSSAESIASRPIFSINRSISIFELLKIRANRLALAIFNPGKKDVDLGDGLTFGQLFPDTEYGAGFTQGFCTFLAYSICLEELSLEQVAKIPQDFVWKIQSITECILRHLTFDTCDLSHIPSLARGLANQQDFNNYSFVPFPIIQSLYFEDYVEYLDDESLIYRMRQCHALSAFTQFVDNPQKK